MRGLGSAAIAAVALLLSGISVSAQSPSAAPSTSPSPSAIPFPWPTLPPPEQVLVPAPFEPKGPPTASTSRHGIRVELWLSSPTAAPGEWVQAVVRTTNLGKRTAWAYPGPCNSPGTSITVDLRPVVSLGQAQTGNAAKFKEKALRDGGRLRDSFMPRRLLHHDAAGARVIALAECGIEPQPRALGARRTTQERFAWYAAGSFDGEVWYQPLPPGAVPMEVEWPFMGRGTLAELRSHPRASPVTVKATIMLTGDGPGTPSLPELVDRALAEPTFRAWVEEDPTRESWYGVSMSGWPGAAADGGLPLVGPFEPGAFGVIRVELDHEPLVRGIVSMDPWTGEVLDVAFE